MGVSALIYLREEGYDSEFVDPMVMKMQGFAQFLRDRNLNFLTIVGEPKDKIFNQQSEADLSGLWILHGPSGINEQYPFELDADLISVQMLMMWSRQIILSIEIPGVEGYITDLAKLEENERGEDHDQVLKYY